MTYRSVLRQLFPKILVLVAFSAVLLPCFSVVSAQTEYDAQIDEKESEKQQKEDELAESQSRQYSYQQEGLTLSEKLDALAADLYGLDAGIAENEAQIAEIEEQIRVKNDEVSEKKVHAGEISRSLYKLSRTNILELLLSADGVTDLLNKIGFQNFGMGNLLDQVKGLKAELFEFSAQYEEMSARSAQLTAELAQMQQDRVALENQKAAYEQLIYAEKSRQDELISEIILIEGEIGELSEKAEDALKDKAGEEEGPGDGGGGGGGGGTSPQEPMGDPGRYDLYADGVLVSSDAAGPIRLVPVSSYVFAVDGGLGQYRGVLEFRSDTNVFIINELGFEYYLRGIGEMSSSWPMEALKSQAVAARTYGAANWWKRSDLGYNLRDDTYDQNYVGYSKEIGWYGDQWVAAVDATAGQVIYAGADLISAYYHSTCGGHTLASAEVWGGEKSYAQAESDWYNNGGWHSYDGDSPWSYKRWGSGDIDGAQLEDLLNAGLWLEINGASVESQDNVIRPDLGPGWNADQLRAALGANSITNQVGTIQSVTQIYNTGGSSIESSVRLTQGIRVTGTSGTKDIIGYMFKLAFNLRSPADDFLYSSLWDVVNEGGSYNFYSRGYPHRIGMCQYGAYGRANAGQGYADILSHYYRGTSLGGFTPPSAFRVGITYVGGPTTIVSADGGFDIYANGTNIASGQSGQTWMVVKK